MGYILTGDQQKTASRRIGEILRQFGQDEYPYDPERAFEALQAVSEGRFDAVGGEFPSMIYAADLIPDGYVVVEDVARSKFHVRDLEFVAFLNPVLAYVSGKEMRRLSVVLRGDLGLCDAKLIHDQQLGIPKELREGRIVFPGTVLQSHSQFFIPYLKKRQEDIRWSLAFRCLDDTFSDKDFFARRK